MDLNNKMINTMSHNRARPKLPQELLLKILKYAMPEPKMIEFSIALPDDGRPQWCHCRQNNSFAGSEPEDGRGQVISNLALVSYAFKEEIYRHFSMVIAVGPFNSFSSRMGWVLKPDGYALWTNHQADTLNIFHTCIMRMVATQQRTMLKSRMQKLSVSNNIYTWWYDDEFELSDILDFAQEMFPELKDLTLILGDHGNEGWEDCNEHQESHGNLRLINIDKNFLEMERRLTNYGTCRFDRFYWDRDDKQEQFYNDAEEYRIAYSSYTSLDQELWKNITFKVQMRAYFDEGNAGWDYSQFSQSGCGKGATLYRSPALWIETLQCYVPCDANGENIASKYDGLVELFEGYQPKFESWFRRERVSKFPEATA